MPVNVIGHQHRLCSVRCAAATFCKTSLRHKYFPYFMAFYQPGKHQVSPAEWMQAVLLYGKHRQAEGEAAQQPAAVGSYAGYGEASKAALLLTLQQWYHAADADSRKALGMPSAKTLEEL